MEISLGWTQCTVNGETAILWLGAGVSPQILQDLYGVGDLNEIDKRMVSPMCTACECLLTISFLMTDGTTKITYTTVRASTSVIGCIANTAAASLLANPDSAAANGRNRGESNMRGYLQPLIVSQMEFANLLVEDANNDALG